MRKGAGWQAAGPPEGKETARPLRRGAGQQGEDRLPQGLFDGEAGTGLGHPAHQEGFGTLIERGGVGHGAGEVATAQALGDAGGGGIGLPGRGRCDQADAGQRGTHVQLRAVQHAVFGRHAPGDGRDQRHEAVVQLAFGGHAAQ